MADYNGWTNWETWNANLWATNEYGLYQEVCRVSRNNDCTASEVENCLREMFPTGTPDMDPGDMDKVNYDEIAESWNEE